MQVVLYNGRKMVVGSSGGTEWPIVCWCAVKKLLSLTLTVVVVVVIVVVAVAVA